MIVIIEHDKIAQLQMPRSTCRLACDTLHCAAISKNGVSVVVEEVESRFVEYGRGMSLGDGQSDRIRETLSEWPCGDLDPWSVVGLGVTRGDAVDLLLSSGLLAVEPIRGVGCSAYAESFQVIQRQFVAIQMQQGVLQQASVSIRQHKAISIEPAGIAGVEIQEPVEEYMGCGSQAHRGTRMSTVCCESGIDLFSQMSVVRLLPIQASVIKLRTFWVLGKDAGLSWRGRTYRQNPNCVDSQLIFFTVSHDDRGFE